ncbi:M56 family metallopeptidase [Aquisalinus flavus]|uniref:Peptidase M56 domain-containing protein n=1 Tax=Aquisalinus flavus TaxID=1526572 RepID=A0A8J2V354_9PROT|nr:M56 family metallopeptidase [Aquisalinus flavus]MBD0426348.1 M56 family metallopeptidase [Aquisalinus flavus]UNE48086.1 M56 family metallopeptidase [Aquisalinus flavus]GGD08692.1 hypothetical protein GCM10011342_16890 [Aquisalinus flavus]
MDLPGLFTEIAFRHLWQGLLIIGIVSLLLAGKRFWSAEHRSWLWTAGLVLSAILPVATLIDIPTIQVASAAAPGAGMAVPAAAAPAIHPVQVKVFAPLAGALEMLPLPLILAALVSIWIGVGVWKIFRIVSAARQTHDLVQTLKPCPLSTDMLPRDWPEEIDVMQAEGVRTPMAIGLFSYRVILPASLVASLPTHQIRHVLSHELAHIRRGDLQFALVQRLIEAVFWWSPLTAFIGARLREEREMACDDRAVAMNGCSRQYASALLESVTLLVADKRKHGYGHLHGKSCSDMLALSAFDHQSRGAFRARIRRLIGQGYRARVDIGRIQIAGVSMAGVAVLGLFLLSPRGVLSSGLDTAVERPYLTAGMESSMPDKGFAMSDASLQALLNDLRAASPEAIRIEMIPAFAEIPLPRLAIAAAPGPESLPAVGKSGLRHPEEQCQDPHHHDHDADFHMDMDSHHDIDIDVNTITAMATSARIEIEKLEMTSEVVNPSPERTTEVIVITREGNSNRVVKQVIRHRDAQSLSIASRDGRTLTMTLQEGMDGTFAYQMSGGVGEIVTVQ